MSSVASQPEYAQFRQTFFAESVELLADMDERLERLAEQGLDREEIDAVFRAVHSIKAGAGMFNYADLVAFAHAFESLLDRLRDGRIGLEVAVVRLVMRSADTLAELVSAAQENRSAGDGFGHDLRRELLDMAELPGATPKAQAPASTAIQDLAEPVGDARRIWRINFKPRAEMLRHANEPLLIIRELAGLGELEATCDVSRLPGLAALDVDDAWLSWQFKLVADCDEAAIREVFEFVEDDAEISVQLEQAPAQSTVDDDDGFGLWAMPEPAQPTQEAFGLWQEPAVASPTPVAQQTAARAPDKQTGSIRVDLGRVDRLVNIVGELIIAQAMLRQQISHLNEAEGLEVLESLTREMQDCVMSVRMQPVKSVFSRMPRLVRDIAAKLDKQVRLTMSGEQTELDKTVIEELSDPLTHMIRNSVDHGIETPANRLAAGKIAEGSIRLSAAHVGSNILIQIEDDGAGINRARLLSKAIEKGIVPAGARLSDEETLDLIFAPGFSTAAQISDVSGRGVGMDVVRRNIQKIGGRIQVHSLEGQGTRFSLIIPLTLAVLDGMLVSVGQERYIVPLTSIVESFRPSAGQIRALAGGVRVAQVRGDYFPLISLKHVFAVESGGDNPTQGLVVLIETVSGGRIGLVVDELLGQQQVVIKSLQENFSPVAGVSGATILGDGNVALILDVEQLCRLDGNARVGTASREPAEAGA